MHTSAHVLCDTWIDVRCAPPRPTFLAQNTELVKRPQGVVQRKGCTVGQLALAWVLTQGADVMPTPGGRQARVDSGHFHRNVPQPARQLRISGIT